MQYTQPGILAPVPRLARYLTFRARPDSDPARALAALSTISDGESAVVGFGRRGFFFGGRVGSVAASAFFGAIAGAATTT